MSNIFGSGKFQQIGSKSTFRKYDNWDAGDQVLGKLVQIGQDMYKKPSYIIQVEDVSFKKTSEQPKAGELFTLNSAGGLRYKIDQVGGVEIGDTIGVEYKGKAIVEKGTWKGKPCHDIDFHIIKAGGTKAPAPQESNDDLV